MAKHTLKILRCNTARVLKYVWPFLTLLKKGLTHFTPEPHFFIHKKHQTVGLLVFSGGKEIEHWFKMC